MNFKKTLAFALLITFGILPWAAQGAIAPFYQSVRELKDLLVQEDVKWRVGDNFAIEKIRRTTYGYEISSGGCSLPVDMKYLPSPLLGPTRYVFTVRYMNCTDNP